MSAIPGDEPSSTDWCILRTAGRYTLRLAETLAEDGFTTWAPQEVVTYRIPKATVIRKVARSMLPSYVFVQVGEAALQVLREMARMDVKPRRGTNWGKPAHAGFSLMQRSGRIVAVSDPALNNLRKIEAKRRPKIKAEKPFAVGVTVRVRGGVFSGLTGLVSRSNRKSTIVLIGGKTRVELETSFFDLDGLSHR